MKLAIPDSVQAAVQEGRCLRMPPGCGQPIRVDRRRKTYGWPHETYKQRWLLTGLCASCQDQVIMADDGETVVRGLD